MSDAQDDYVAGDINTIDDAGDFDENQDDNDDANEAAPTRPPPRPRCWSSSPSRSPKTRTPWRSRSASARARSSSRSAWDPDDMGRIIGRRGRTAQSIRALVGAAGARDGVTTSVDIVD